MTTKTFSVAAGALVAFTAGAALAAPPAFAGAAAGRTDSVQQRLDHLITDDGFPGALASVRGADGRVRD